jgi:hypothetical protein
VTVVYLVNFAHASIRPRVLQRIHAELLAELYVRVTTTVVITFTLTGLGALVACYYYALRERRIHTSLTEFGLGVRSVLAGLLAAAAFVLALHINAGGLS